MAETFLWSNFPTVGVAWGPCVYIFIKFILEFGIYLFLELFSSIYQILTVQSNVLEQVHSLMLDQRFMANDMTEKITKVFIY